MITRKDTSKLKHYHARVIEGFQVIDNADTQDEEPIVAFVGDKGSKYDSREVTLPMTLEAWDRAANGVGTVPEDLANGLDRVSRYRFVVLTDKIPTVKTVKETDPKTGEEKDVSVTINRETVVGIHVFPDTNYINADFSAELNRPIPDNVAVTEMYESGEIDVIAFPGAMQRDIVNFVRALESVTKIDNRTKVETAEAVYTISSSYGSEVTFKVKKKR